MQQARPNKINHLSVAKMLAYLIEVPATPNELAEHTGLHPKTTRKYMHALHDEGVAHISGWEPDSQGKPRTPVYTFGSGKDAKKPIKSKTLANQQWRARKQQMDIQAAMCGVSA